MDSGDWLLTSFLLLCVLPLLVFAVLAFVTYRAGKQRLEVWLSPNVARMHAEYEALFARHPEMTPNDALSRIIRGQAVKAGVIGALTSVGGLVTLPIALPIDIVLSFRLQASLISFIGHHFGASSSDSHSATVSNYLIMTGSSRVTQSTTRFLIGATLRVLGKSFSKLIPIVGALIGFCVNYAIVHVMGKAVLRWHSNMQDRKAGRVSRSGLERLGDCSPSLDPP